jgi:hypothetical protein
MPYVERNFRRALTRPEPLSMAAASDGTKASTGL